MSIELKTDVELIKPGGFDPHFALTRRLRDDALAAHALLLAMKEVSAICDTTSIDHKMARIVLDQIDSRAAHHHNRMIRGE